MVTTRLPKTIVMPTALRPVANTDTKQLIYGLFQKGGVLAQDGVVIAVAQERSNAGVLQPVETPDELDLRRETAISAVEYIAGYEKRSSMTIYTEVDHALVSIERCTSKDLRDLRLRLANALKRAVEVKVRRMHKAKGHVVSIYPVLCQNSALGPVANTDTKLLI